MWDDHLDSWRRVCAAGNLYHIKSAKRERCEMLYFFICISSQKMQRNKKQLSSLNLHGCMRLFLSSSCSFVMKKLFSFWLRNLLDELTSCQIKWSQFSLDAGEFISSAADSGVRRWLDDQTLRVRSSDGQMGGGSCTSCSFDGRCQAVRPKFHQTPGAFVLLTGRKSWRQQWDWLLLVFCLSHNPRWTQIIVQKTRTEANMDAAAAFTLLECFNWGFSYLILEYPLAADIITAEPVQFFNSNVSGTAFAHFPNFARIGSKRDGRLRIRCCQDVRTIPWKGPSWSQKLLCWLFFFGCPENPEKVLK